VLLCTIRARLPYGSSARRPRAQRRAGLRLCPRRPAAVFDGHGGVSAGEYLCKELYSVLSDAIDEETYGEECSLEGAPARAPTAACVGPA